MILDHPADLGIEAYGQTLAESFEQAALGLISVILDPATVRQVEAERLISTEPTSSSFWLSG
jgi:SHS2 domain-containing protein